MVSSTIDSEPSRSVELKFQRIIKLESDPLFQPSATHAQTRSAESGGWLLSSFESRANIARINAISSAEYACWNFPGRGNIVQVGGINQKDPDVSNDIHVNVCIIRVSISN